MLHKYYEEIGINTIPRLDSEGIPYAERNHTFEIVPGLKVKVVMDIIEENGIVRDYKTSKKSPSAKVIDETIQLPTYALAYRDMFGEKETAVGLDYAVNLKREKKVMRLETEGPIDDGRIERVKQTFVGVAQSISAGIFYPNEESNACGYCSFNQICKKIK
jgi:CRISPR/Cas system-associated exonuclease Cas4 (RecB family)